MIAPGKLIHSVAIEKKVTQRDTYGAEIVTWVEVARAWASVEPLSGREYFQAQQMQASVDYRITMNYQPGIVPTMRVKWNDRGFNIRSVINTEERNIELILMCQEFVLKEPAETA